MMIYCLTKVKTPHRLGYRGLAGTSHGSGIKKRRPKEGRLFCYRLRLEVVGQVGCDPAWGFRDDKTIGFEFDLIQEIQIYKNLKYVIGAGYLFAGKALDYGYVGAAPLPPFALNSKPKDPWQITTNLTYNF